MTVDGSVNRGPGGESSSLDTVVVATTGQLDKRHVLER